MTENALNGWGHWFVSVIVALIGLILTSRFVSAWLLWSLVTGRAGAPYRLPLSILTVAGSIYLSLRWSMTRRWQTVVAVEIGVPILVCLIYILAQGM